MSTRVKKTRKGASAVVVGAYAALLFYTVLVIFGPFLLAPVGRETWCPEAISTQVTPNGTYENPDYDTDPCRYVRIPHLLYLTLEECDLSRRMLASVVFGGAIGYERRSSDRPAGIRTMGLVSLGACFFTICSQLAFKSSTMVWDSSRVSAAIPSGVGFLGAGLISKGSAGSGTKQTHQVHGLTTAASIWLSASVGVGAGGALYFVSAYSVALIVLILRYGPRLYLQKDEEYEDDTDEDDYDDDTDDKLNDNEDPNKEKRSNEVSAEKNGEDFDAKKTVSHRPNQESRIPTAKHFISIRPSFLS